MRNSSNQGKVGRISKHGTKKGTNMVEHGGLKSMNKYILMSQKQQCGTRGEIIINIEVERNWVNRP